MDKILIIGDLHLDDYNPRGHKDYWGNVKNVMKDIIELNIKEKPSTIVFAGDFIGTRKNAKTKQLKALGKITKDFLLDGLKGNNPDLDILVVKGNHDYSNDSAFDFLEGLGFINTLDRTKPLEFKGSGNRTLLEMKLVDYGLEDEEIEWRLKTSKKIIVGHNDFEAKGFFSSFIKDKGINILTKESYLEADYIYSGHIHKPSEEPKTIKVVDDKETRFLNLGCPTRPTRSDKFNNVWYSLVTIDTKVTIENKVFELQDYKEIFNEVSTVDYLSTEHNKITKTREEALEDILKSIEQQDRGSSITIKEYIKEAVFFTDEAKNRALDYLNKIHEEDL